MLEKPTNRKQRKHPGGGSFLMSNLAGPWMPRLKLCLSVSVRVFWMRLALESVAYKADDPPPGVAASPSLLNKTKGR